MLVKRLQAAAGSPDTLEDLEEDETESPTTHVEGA
jgi:hypothetical protein